MFSRQAFFAKPTAKRTARAPTHLATPLEKRFKTAKPASFLSTGKAAAKAKVKADLFRHLNRDLNRGAPATSTLAIMPAQAFAAPDAMPSDPSVPGDASELSTSGTDDSGGELLDIEHEAQIRAGEEEMKRGRLKIAAAKSAQAEYGSRGRQETRSDRLTVMTGGMNFDQAGRLLSVNVKHNARLT